MQHIYCWGQRQTACKPPRGFCKSGKSVTRLSLQSLRSATTFSGRAPTYELLATQAHSPRRVCETLPYRRDVKHCRIADFRPAGVRSTAALQGSMHFLPHRQSTQTQVGVAQCKLTHSITNITQPTVTVRIRDPDGFPGTQYHPPRSSRVDQRRWGSV